MLNTNNDLGSNNFKTLTKNTCDKILTNNIGGKTDGGGGQEV